MAKLAIFIDHDLIIRHFILNRVLPQLEREHELLFVFPENHRRVKTDPATLDLARYRSLKVSDERMLLYRHLYQASVLWSRRQAADKQAVFDFWRRVLGPSAYRRRWLCSWPGTYQLYRQRMIRRIGRNAELMNLLDEEQPDLILHPTVLEGLFVSDLVRAGQELNIPTLFIMNSWDNPATKAMTLGYPDVLAVWGEQTARHAVQHMGMPAERIALLGAAQFDLYKRPPRECRAKFRRKIGVTEDRKILLYAGSSKGLNETRHLQSLEKAVETGRLPDCTVLYRPHPWKTMADGERDFRELSWNHVVLSPDMWECYAGSVAGKPRITAADYENTHVTLSAVDAIVSPLSTILLEAVLHGKPVVAYLPDEDMSENFFLRTTANMVHFTDFFARIDCIRCERPEDLVDDCRRLLVMSDQPGMAERLRNQCSHFVEPATKGYVERLLELIGRTLDGKSAVDVKKGNAPPIQGDVEVRTFAETRLSDTSVLRGGESGRHESAAPAA